MIDVSSETLVLLTVAGRDLPGRPHTSTVIRWATRGVRGQRLDTVLVGGRRFTSREAIQRFIAAINNEMAGPNISVSPPRDNKRTDRALDAHRI